MGTKIEWCTETYNPIVGCSKVSPGCDNCYAEKMAKRLAHMGVYQYQNVLNHEWIKDEDGDYTDCIRYDKWSGETYLVKEALDKPLHWKKPRMIFVTSMGDLFHESVPFEWIDKVFSIIQKCKQHTFLILTKRPERMRQYFQDYCRIRYPYLNIWLGVTCENQELADKRILILLDIPAAKRFVSVEPLLSNIDLTYIKLIDGDYLDAINGMEYFSVDHTTKQDSRQVNKLDWVICGSESGSGRRECNEHWVRSLRDQCVKAKVPFFLKQLHRNGKKITMPELDGKEWNQIPK